MSDIYKLILTKQGIFESVNRTTITITSVFIALLASTQTQIYEKDYFKLIIKLIALLLLCINILYAYNNIDDFDKFLKKYQNEYDLKNLQQKVQYMYILMLLLIFLVIINLYLLVN